MREIRPALTLLLIFAVLLGIAYPLAVTGIGQVLFPTTANGSLIERDGQIVGSRLIGQNFTRPEYFHPRPSASQYDATASGGTNLAPSNSALISAIRDRTSAAARDSGGRPVPIDLVTASASGLDPHISPQSAYIQVSRVARVRQLQEDALRKLIDEHTEEQTFDMLGQARVNVLALNMALDELTRRRSQQR